jgi:hypothetical protein
LKETALPILQPIGCLLGQTLFEREESYVNRPTHFTAYRLFAWPNFVQKRGVLCKPLSKNNRGFFPFVQKWPVSNGLNENHPEMPGANFFPKKCCAQTTNALSSQRSPATIAPTI